MIRLKPQCANACGYLLDVGDADGLRLLMFRQRRSFGHFPLRGQSMGDLVGSRIELLQQIPHPTQRRAPGCDRPSVAAPEKSPALPPRIAGERDTVIPTVSGPGTGQATRRAPRVKCLYVAGATIPL